jgi:drug/metabolite transporter (DMT)-like permease
LFGSIFFSERPDALTWLGICIICLAGIGAAVRQRRLKTK